VVSKAYLAIGCEPLVRMTLGALGCPTLEKQILFEKETISLLC
jgi:hypothetical protein